ncbi:hypothetical protein EDC01DRAFT_783141 [Geopyxis carbonaria]|nr:hypothetical protein EDC01DRAFT_783141 [Geopyxis carbonaria]
MPKLGAIGVEATDPDGQDIEVPSAPVPGTSTQQTPANRTTDQAGNTIPLPRRILPPTATRPQASTTPTAATTPQASIRITDADGNEVALPRRILPAAPKTGTVPIRITDPDGNPVVFSKTQAGGPSAPKTAPGRKQEKGRVGVTMTDLDGRPVVLPPPQPRIVRERIPQIGTWSTVIRVKAKVKVRVKAKVRVKVKVKVKAISAATARTGTGTTLWTPASRVRCTVTVGGSRTVPWTSRRCGMGSIKDSFKDIEDIEDIEVNIEDNIQRKGKFKVKAKGKVKLKDKFKAKDRHTYANANAMNGTAQGQTYAGIMNGTAHANAYAHANAHGLLYNPDTATFTVPTSPSQGQSNSYSPYPPGRPNAAYGSSNITDPAQSAQYSPNQYASQQYSPYGNASVNGQQRRRSSQALPIVDPVTKTSPPLPPMSPHEQQLKFQRPRGQAVEILHPVPRQASPPMMTRDDSGQQRIPEGQYNFHIPRTRARESRALDIVDPVTKRVSPPPDLSTNVRREVQTSGQQKYIIPRPRGSSALDVVDPKTGRISPPQPAVNTEDQNKMNGRRDIFTIPRQKGSKALDIVDPATGKISPPHSPVKTERKPIFTIPSRKGALDIKDPVTGKISPPPPAAKTEKKPIFTIPPRKGALDIKDPVTGKISPPSELKKTEKKPIFTIPKQKGGMAMNIFNPDTGKLSPPPALLGALLDTEGPRKPLFELPKRTGALDIKDPTTGAIVTPPSSPPSSSGSPPSSSSLSSSPTPEARFRGFTFPAAAAVPEKPMFERRASSGPIRVVDPATGSVVTPPPLPAPSPVQVRYQGPPPGVPENFGRYGFGPVLPPSAPVGSVGSPSGVGSSSVGSSSVGSSSLGAGPVGAGVGSGLRVPAAPQQRTPPPRFASPVVTPRPLNAAAQPFVPSDGPAPHAPTTPATNAAMGLPSPSLPPLQYYAALESLRLSSPSFAFVRPAPLPLPTLRALASPPAPATPPTDAAWTARITRETAAAVASSRALAAAASSGAPTLPLLLAQSAQLDALRATADAFVAAAPFGPLAPCSPPRPPPLSLAPPPAAAAPVLRLPPLDRSYGAVRARFDAARGFGSDDDDAFCVVGGPAAVAPVFAPREKRVLTAAEAEAVRVARGKAKVEGIRRMKEAQDAEAEVVRRRIAAEREEARRRE